MKKIPKLNLRRVDVQVSVFTACVVIVSCICLFVFDYSITYSDMIYSLRERVNSIYSYVETDFDKTTFKSINTKDDIYKTSYIEMRQFLHDIKQSTGVQYLYTAKRNADGDLIYVIDGLSEAEDFRYPGDLIESEITDSLIRALNGEKILPEDIVHTEWGDIFIAYMPVHNAKREVVGAVGIEFPATHQYTTYRTLRAATPIIIILTCSLSAIFSVMYFRRISNPHYQDLANTDTLTGLKNRNAYELDLKNLRGLNNTKNLGFILADLNGLKRINDSLGHEKGDLYIRLLAISLIDASLNKEIPYRVGGDEFVILVKNATDEKLSDYIARASELFAEKIDGVIPDGCCAFGKSICAGNSISDCEKAYQHADKNMYSTKNNYYANMRTT